jgi:hypothetical protein
MHVSLSTNDYRHLKLLDRELRAFDVCHQAILPPTESSVRPTSSRDCFEAEGSERWPGT